MQESDICFVGDLKCLGIVDVGLIKWEPDDIPEGIDLEIGEKWWGPQAQIEVVNFVLAIPHTDFG